MKLSIKAGATSQSINVFIQDSSKTDGSGLTGLAFNTSGLTAYYALPRAASVQITLATLAAVTSAYSSGGFKEIDATNMPGWYRLDLPDAAIASGRFVSLHLRGAANMAPCPVEIELTGWDNQDAVHGGLSALPNTACTTNASLLTSGTGTDQISVSAGKVLLQATQTGVTIPTVTTVTNGVTVSTNNDKTGYALTAAYDAAKTAGTSTLTASQVWDELTAGHTTPNTYGYQVKLNLDVAVSSRGTATLTAGDVWDVALASHLTSGSTGAALNAAGSAGDPWATALPGAYGSGTAGNILGNRLDVAVSTRGTGTSTLDAAGVRSAVGLTSANLDTQLSGVPAAVWASGSRTLSAFGFSVTVGTNNDKTGYSLVSGPLDAAGTRAALGMASANLDTQLAALDSDVLSRLAATSYSAPLDAAGTRSALGLATANLDTQLAAIPTATENADEALKRDWTAVSGEAARSTLNALRALRNKWSVAGGTLTVTKEDDTTSAWTSAVTATAGADPITASDPA